LSRMLLKARMIVLTYAVLRVRCTDSRDLDLDSKLKDLDLDLKHEDLDLDLRGKDLDLDLTGEDLDLDLDYEDLITTLVATHLRRGGILTDSIITNVLSGINLKIGQYLIKLWRMKLRRTKMCQFLVHPVYMSS